jgi:GT2 family glycosyltransferase
MPDAPRTSIVTATYNRSNVLRHTLAASRASTTGDWEHLIVGDACTDDTGQVVAACHDDRLRFVNLPSHVGEQSGPNNEGVRLARGAFIAFLNHDDLWLPHHLEAAVRALEDTGADMVFALTITIDARQRAHLAGVTSAGRYEGRGFAPASSWVCRRALVDEIGPWRAAASLHAAPSTDWIERVHRAGKVILALPEVGVVALLSGGRRNSYAERHEHEYARLAAALRDDPRCVTSLVTQAALDLARAQRATGPLLARALRNGAAGLVSAAGLHPARVLNAVRYRRRGGLIDHLRQTRGLPPLPRGRK